MIFTIAVMTIVVLWTVFDKVVLEDWVYMWLQKWWWVNVLVLDGLFSGHDDDEAEMYLHFLVLDIFIVHATPFYFHAQIGYVWALLTWHMHMKLHIGDKSSVLDMYGSHAGWCRAASYPPDGNTVIL